MTHGRTMKKKRVGGRPPGLSGLTINTGSYKIPTTLGGEEINAMVAELQTIQGRNVEAYEHISQIATKLLSKPGAITLEGDVAQVEHAKAFAEAAVAANNVKRAKYDKAENVANIVIGVLERIRGSMTGGAGFLNQLKGLIGMSDASNNVVTSEPNVHELDHPGLELTAPPQPNMSQQEPPMNQMTLPEPAANTMVNEPMTGGKRRKPKKTQKKTEEESKENT